MTETATLQDVYNEIIELKQRMVSKEEVENLLETVEILHNPKTMSQVKASEADIKGGRTKPINNMKDLLEEL
ncbi:MAG: hypothetical protein AABX47_10785 [Nanoarchaeota archaeon]